MPKSTKREILSKLKEVQAKEESYTITCGALFFGAIIALCLLIENIRDLKCLFE